MVVTHPTVTGQFHAGVDGDTGVLIQEVGFDPDQMAEAGIRVGGAGIGGVERVGSDAERGGAILHAEIGFQCHGGGRHQSAEADGGADRGGFNTFAELI